MLKLMQTAFCGPDCGERKATSNGHGGCKDSASALDLRLQVETIRSKRVS
jgi:hypothetical protein